MIDAINLTPMQASINKIPDLEGVKNNAEIDRAAQDFASVFFNECVSKMMDEVKKEDNDFANDVYGTLFAQALGEKLSSSTAGENITNIISRDLLKLQEGAHR